MKVIDCKKKLISLAGQVLVDENKEETTVGRVMANVIIMHRGGKASAAKAYVMAKNFYESDSVELDDVDFKIVSEILTSDQNYSSLVIGQVEQYLNGLA